MSKVFQTDTEVREWVQERYPDSEILIPSGYPTAFIGIDDSDETAMYNKEEMIMTLVRQDSMPASEAREFLEFNTWGAYIENGPRYVDTPQFG